MADEGAAAAAVLDSLSQLAPPAPPVPAPVVVRSDAKRASGVVVRSERVPPRRERSTSSDARKGAGGVPSGASQRAPKVPKATNVPKSKGTGRNSVKREDAPARQTAPRQSSERVPLHMRSSGRTDGRHSVGRNDSAAERTRPGAAVGVSMASSSARSRSGAAAQRYAMRRCCLAGLCLLMAVQIRRCAYCGAEVGEDD